MRIELTEEQFTMTYKAVESVTYYWARVGCTKKAMEFSRLLEALENQKETQQ